jgi:hypothetical protein
LLCLLGLFKVECGHIMLYYGFLYP